MLHINIDTIHFISLLDTLSKRTENRFCEYKNEIGPKYISDKILYDLDTEYCTDECSSYEIAWDHDENGELMYLRDCLSKLFMEPDLTARAFIKNNGDQYIVIYITAGAVFDIRDGSWQLLGDIFE